MELPHPYPDWLKDYYRPKGDPLKKKRRSVKTDIKKRLSPREAFNLITAKSWPYEGSRKDFLQVRDGALLALFYLTCGRVTEVLSLEKTQFNFTKDPDVLIIENMLTVKKTKGNIYKEEVPLPKRGDLAPFTKLVIKYLAFLPENAKLFRISRQRAWAITKHVTGQWCHYFRSQSESYYAKLTRDLAWLKDFVNLESADSLLDYVKTPWTDYRSKILEEKENGTR